MANKVRKSSTDKSPLSVHHVMKRQRRAELSNEEDSRAPRKTSKMHKHDSTDHLTEGSAKTNKVRLFID